MAIDRASLRTIIDVHHRPLHAFLFRLTNDATLADDLTQQTFIRLLTYDGDAPDNLRGWLLTVGRNLAYDYFRSAQYRHEEAADFADNASIIPDNALTPEQITINADQQQTVAALLDRLPISQREVLVLRYYHDLPLAEIAGVVDAPVGTVKSRLFHALKKLKGHLMEVGHTHDNTTFER